MNAAVMNQDGAGRVKFIIHRSAFRIEVL